MKFYCQKCHHGGTCIPYLILKFTLWIKLIYKAGKEILILYNRPTTCPLPTTITTGFIIKKEPAYYYRTFAYNSEMSTWEVSLLILMSLYHLVIVSPTSEYLGLFSYPASKWDKYSRLYRSYLLCGKSLTCLLFLFLLLSSLFCGFFLKKNTICCLRGGVVVRLMVSSWRGWGAGAEFDADGIQGSDKIRS